MNRKVPLLLLSHACVFGVAFGVSRQSGTSISTWFGRTGGSAAPTKTGLRIESADQGKGQRLLKEYLESRKKPEPDFDSTYRKLASSLPVAKDVKAAAMEEIAKLDRPIWAQPTEEEEWKARAIVEVRALHWLRQDPAGAMEFLLEDDVSFRHSLAFHFERHVFKDLIAEKGLAACLPWLTKASVTTLSFYNALVAEVQSGGGVAALEKVHSAMMAVPEQAAYFAAASSPSNPWGGGEQGPFFRAAKVLPFSEREALLEMASRQQKETDQVELLRGFSRTSPQAAAWLLENIQRGDLQGTVVERVRQEAIASVRKGSGADMEMRVSAMAGAPGKAGVSREDLAMELLGEDVAGLLKEGRDWRYEFRHGAASASEVLAAMQATLPAGSDFEGASLSKALFRHLVEEDPVQARQLIAGLPESERRSVEYEALQRGFAKATPELFSAYLTALPAAKTEGEQAQRQEALREKAAAYAERFGDGYEQSVKSMAKGADRDAAVKGVVEETRKKNPSRASDVEQRLSSPEP